MSLGDHLRELRKRLFRAAAGLIAGAVGGWFLVPYLLDAMRAPVLEIAHRHELASLNFPNITSAFDLKLEMAVTIGAVISSPIWLYQIFAFLVPGLNRREKKYVFGFFFSAVPLFFAGCFAGWYVLPHIVGLLTSFAGRQDSTLIDAPTYYGFVMKLVIIVGVAFVLPVFMVLLNFMGILSAAVLRRSWRVAMIIIVLFTATATPSVDVVSMFLLAAPMAVLYFAATGISMIHDRRAAKLRAKLSAELTP
ncbi:MAG TPA: twin-arginine translocase subunit TatC [Microbacteriaceae bacterium]|nr:twin-arginine translocase subunit TatC [Microbacteriaceae bacterium]